MSQKAKKRLDSKNLKSTKTCYPKMVVHLTRFVQHIFTIILKKLSYNWFYLKGISAILVPQSKNNSTWEN